MFRNKLGCYIFRVCNWIYTHKEVEYTKLSILMPKNQWNKKCHYHITGYPYISLLAAGFGFITYSLLDMKYVVYADDSQYVRVDDKKTNLFDNNLPIYSTREVSKHSNYQERIWVTYKNGVYDVTDFIHEHPGGDQILMAAGGAVDPFWMLYSVHLNPHVLNILEKYRIGNLDPKENNDNTSDMSDPYSNEPKRHVILKPACVKPFNAESPEQLLVENFITPNELFYVRNHLPVPDIDPNNYSLEIEIEGKSKSFTLTLDELKRFPKYSVTATVMCAGNRRSEMTKVKPVKGLNWGAAAVGNATWSGASLSEVLKKAGLNEKDLDKYKHVQFEAFDTDATGTAYGASIPIWKAVDRRGDVILAYEMNGIPLPRDHGFPIRVIVPGVVGARNVKWLGKIIVSSEESQSHWQQNDYKGFSPSTDWDTVDFSKSPSIQELPVTSAICQPVPNSTVTVENGQITVRGYAWSGGGQDIVRVDVTSDAGKTWHVADLENHDPQNAPQHWSWVLWSCKLPVTKEDKKVEIWAKAVDSSYNTQPESFENIWNLRGVLNNAYHRVTVNLA